MRKQKNAWVQQDTSEAMAPPQAEGLWTFSPATGTPCQDLSTVPTQNHPLPWSGRSWCFKLEHPLPAGSYRVEAQINASYPLIPKLLFAEPANTLIRLSRTAVNTYGARIVLTKPTDTFWFAPNDLIAPLHWQSLTLKRQSKTSFYLQATKQFVQLALTDRRRAATFIRFAFDYLVRGKSPAAVSGAQTDFNTAYAKWVERYDTRTVQALTLDSTNAPSGFGAFVAGGETWYAPFASDYTISQRLVEAIEATSKQYTDLQLVVFDDDLIDEAGTRSAPFFRPVWSPARLIAWNYVGRAFAVNKSAYERAVGLIPLDKTAPLHDLLRRLDKALKGYQRHDLPAVLGCWHSPKHGADPRLTTIGENAPNPTLTSGPHHLSRIEAADGLSSFAANRLRSGLVDTGTLDHSPTVDILIPTRDRLELLKACLESIWTTTSYPAYQIIVIDNGSQETATLQFLEQKQKSGAIKLVRDDGPFNFSRLNNGAAQTSSADYLLCLNNDTTVVNKEWLSELIAAAHAPDIGAVGAKLYFPNGSIQHAGLVMGLASSVAGHVHKEEAGKSAGYFASLVATREVTALTAACLLVRRDLFWEVGGFEEQHLPVAFNDVDLCLKLRSLGKRLIWTPYAELIHHESISRGRVETGEAAVRAAKEVDYMRRRWGLELRVDPYYSPNLSLESHRVRPSQ